MASGCGSHACLPNPCRACVSDPRCVTALKLNKCKSPSTTSPETISSQIMGSAVQLLFLVCRGQICILREKKEKMSFYITRGVNGVPFC